MVEKNDEKELVSKETDAYILEVSKLLNKAKHPKEGYISVISPARASEFYKAFGYVKKSISGKGVTFSQYIEDPAIGVGCITIKGKSIKVNDPWTFAIAARYASNTELYPLVDGTLVLDMTFYGITKTERGVSK